MRDVNISPPLKKIYIINFTTSFLMHSVNPRGINRKGRVVHIIYNKVEGGVVFHRLPFVVYFGLLFGAVVDDFDMYWGKNS